MRVLKKLIAVLAAGALGILPVLAGSKSEKPMMKAAIVHEYGGPEALKVESVARPEPKENEVLVRVIAAGVNPIDSLSVAGKNADSDGTRLPLIPGYDISGVVTKAGKKVTRLKVGDAVYAYLLWGGGWAEYAVATEAEAIVKPKSISFVTAAAVPLAALTAWQALIGAARLEPGQTVLIHGGSGGVGTMAIQIAKAHGAKVIATASTPNQDLLKELGADKVIDYTQTKFEDVVKDVDAVLDTVGSDTLARSYGVLKRGGCLVTLVSRLDQSELEKHGIRGASIAVRPQAEQLVKITRLIETQKLKPVVTRTLALSDAAEAVRQIGTHHTRGKIVLKVADEPKG